MISLICATLLYLMGMVLAGKLMRVWDDENNDPPLLYLFAMFGWPLVAGVCLWLILISDRNN